MINLFASTLIPMLSLIVWCTNGATHKSETPTEDNTATAITTPLVIVDVHQFFRVFKTNYFDGFVGG